MITKVNLTTNLPTITPPVSISYKAGRFSVWMRVLRNGHLTVLPRKIHYLGTFFITCGERTLVYSLPETEKETGLSSFIQRLTTRCSNFQLSELPPLLQSKLLVA